MQKAIARKTVHTIIREKCALASSEREHLNFQSVPFTRKFMLVTKHSSLEKLLSQQKS